jgi:AraC-like DNA-binding protein
MDSRLSMMRGRVLHMSTREAVREHRTPAYKLVIGVDADLTFTCAGRSGLARAVLVSPCVAQAMEAQGLAVGIFQEAGSALAPYRAVSTSCLSLSGKMRDRLVALARESTRSDGRDDAGFADEAFRLLGLASRSVPESRVARTLERLKRAPDMTLSELAVSADLSSERLRHLIVEQTGMPLSEHRLLRRTTAAIEHLLRGVPIAQSAARSGFADHAHLTRTFGRMFGRSPSSLPARSALQATWAESAFDQSASRSEFLCRS